MKLFTHKFDRQRTIIFAIVVLLVVSVLLLAHTAQKQGTSEGWWALYFSDTEQKSFVIENYTKKQRFTFEITAADGTVVETDALTIPYGKTQTILLKAPAVAVHVTATADEATKEIYRR